MADLYLSTEGPIQKLIEELEDMYPPLTVDPSMTHEVILYRAGQRSVVDYLRAPADSSAGSPSPSSGPSGPRPPDPSGSPASAGPAEHTPGSPAASGSERYN